MAKKFNITQSQAKKVDTKNFLPPAPLIQTKPSVILSKAVLQVVQKKLIGVGFEPSDTEVAKSRYLNTPIYSNLIIEGGEYTDENGASVSYSEMTIDLVLMEINNQKNIIKTSLQGRNGTVKEYISDGDYSIKITGKLFGDGMNSYPSDLVSNLHNICLAPVALTVSSDFLKLFNINSIVIESYNFHQTEGMRNVQEFTLNCLSDRELILLKNA
jgi:hypothetical protein